MLSSPTVRNASRLGFAFAFALSLGACSVNGETSDGDAAGEAASGGGEAPENTGTEQPDASKAADTPLPTPTKPIEMANTAWAANDSDGVVYTTFIDPDGTYRDFRDGERYQIGSWDMPGSNRLCYRPDNAPEGDEGRTCWTVRPPGRDGVMTAVDSDGREVTIRKVKYVVPEGE